MSNKCQGHHHGAKFNNMTFVCCQNCKRYSTDKDAQPAPALQLWIGVCPNEERKS